MEKTKEKKEEAQKSIYQVLLEVKKELGKVAKDKTNPFHKSKYADINSYLEVIEPVLQDHGLVLLQPLSNGDKLYITTEIIYSVTGESIKSVLPLPEVPDPQKLGSAITYYRRYTLASLLAMQAEDDDANAASNKSNTKPVAKPINGVDKPKQVFKYNIALLLDSEKESEVLEWISKNPEIVLSGKIAHSPKKIAVWDQYLISKPEMNGGSYPAFKE